MRFRLVATYERGRVIGADGRTRTGTDVTPRDFKSLASAYFATSA